MTLHDLYNDSDHGQPEKEICPTCRCLSCDGCEQPSCERCGEDFIPTDEWQREFHCASCVEELVSEQDEDFSGEDWAGGFCDNH